MLQLDDLVGQVRHNCDISDAQYAGYFSVCGLALRLRDLYKWEKGLAPWIEDDPPKILEWIGEREDAWESMGKEDLHILCIDGHTFEPFDAESINRVLAPDGLYYGAGYALGLKPSFFLAHIESKKEILGQPVYILGHELARDLLTFPALCQESSVVVRREAGELYLWNQISYLKKSGRPALQFALEAYGIIDNPLKRLQETLGEVFEEEMGAYIHHELGELNERTFSSVTWRELIAAFPNSSIELYSRALRDLLADTNENGTLAYIMTEKKKASLGFYAAFLDGIRRLLFAEMPSAFSRFVEKEDWQIIREAVSICQSRLREHVKAIIAILEAGKSRGDMQWVEGQIEKKLLHPFGIGSGTGRSN